MLTLIGTLIMKILSILLFSLFSLTLQAEDDLNFFKSQHNLGVTHGQYGINYRIYFDDNASEVEFKYKPIKNLQAHIKLAEDDLLQENRYRLTHTIGKYLDTKLFCVKLKSHRKKSFQEKGILFVLSLFIKASGVGPQTPPVSFSVPVNTTFILLHINQNVFFGPTFHLRPFLERMPMFKFVV